MSKLLDFLKEKNVDLVPYCETDLEKSMWREITRLKSELEQQRFNNAHNLSIDQKVSDEIVRHREKNEQLEKMIMKMADYISDEDKEGSLCDEAYELISGGVG